MSYHIRNLQRIEKGEQQPGVNLALRLLAAIGAEPGAFMQKLADECLPGLPHSLSPMGHVTISYEMPQMKEGQKSLFGLFLVQARVAAAVSQTAMAKAAGYNLRNINGVESGRQDPGIMTALALVKATGADVGDFFNALSLRWNELLFNKKN
ncbi:MULTISPECIES: helix-turn-helix transcriptional regulator [unclassified Desulfovibrio]|uniref:helix-turn-helix transcriptional regulator n=1 Tax=unclassified Desulfovibrio TaxID=2593640 RepID=UPI0013ED2F1C|nr:MULTISPECIES: helix-turn-helix transcriptional regulator [unclassified Desulfovibrio]